MDPKNRKTIATIAAFAVAAVAASQITVAQQNQASADQSAASHSGEPRSGSEQSAASGSAFVPLGVSINAIMVASVDHSAHVIWEAETEETLTERDWQILEQHAIILVSAGTLMSMAGTGPMDKQWVADTAWQTWTREYTDSAHAAMAAVEAMDPSALAAAGDALVETCNGCHEAFKSDVPTEGITHVPHYEQL